jgi:hypothetical protein
MFWLSRCNSMKGQFSGPVRWTRVRSMFMMWLSWRTHMTHSWWVEKLLNVCRVDVTLWKVSVKWMSLWDGRELGLCSWFDWVEELIWSLNFVSVDLWVVCLSRCNFMKGEFSGSVRWTRVRSLFWWWCDWVEELIWPLKFVSVELWVVCLSRCNFMWI